MAFWLLVFTQENFDMVVLLYTDDAILLWTLNGLINVTDVMSLITNVDNTKEILLIGKVSTNYVFSLNVQPIDQVNEFVCLRRSDRKIVNEIQETENAGR